MFSRAKLKKWLRRSALLLTLLTVVVGLVTLFWFRGALYNRLVRYPAEQKEWQSIRSNRFPVAEDAGWREFRGILHSHSKNSHDCEVPFEEILRVLKSTGIDFICMSDHCTGGRADFDLQWRGVKDGKLFIPGFEMKEGIMPFGVRPGIVLSNQTDSAVLAKQVIDGGGVLFYAHPEEPRAWDRPELTGMEIFNIHASFKKIGIGHLLPELVVNQRAYPDQVFHSIAQRPTEFLRHWDELNLCKQLTAIAGNDCHQNTGVRIFYTEDGKLRIEDTSPKTISEFRLNFLTRPLAKIAFGPLEPKRLLAHIQLDPYERSARLVNTHVLARELSEAKVLEALRNGRVFVAFDMIADSTGFRWLATNNVSRAVMGESISFLPGIHLQAFSPHDCRFTVMKAGAQVHEAEGHQLDWQPAAAGKYRVEAELKIRNEWTPWIYSNPIELKQPGLTEAAPAPRL
jgi:hypothetical protein